MTSKARSAQLRSLAQSPDAKGLNDHISVRIVRISEAMARLATRTIERRWGISNTDLRLLNTLDGESDGLSVSELARRVHVDKGWISRSVGQLKKRGLLDMQPDPADPRRMLVVLSATGLASLEEVRPHALQSEAALLEGLDARRLKEMLDALEARARTMLDDTE